MSADAAPTEGTIPTPAMVAAEQLAKAPPWLRRLVTSALAVVAWIGLPTTVLSTLSSMQFILDTALWLYRHAGLLRPALSAAGEGISAVVGLWRALTHPIWETLFSWLHIALPTWLPDVLTLVLLTVAGILRRVMAGTAADVRSASLMVIGRARAAPSTLLPIPLAFPYAQHLEKKGRKVTPARLRDIERLWRSWRARQIRMARIMCKSSGPWAFPEDAVRDQFETFWLGVRRGRKLLLIYSIAVGALAMAFAVDWAYRAS
jgi:hypothetical protein